MSTPARSNIPPFEQKSFCMSTTTTAVRAVSIVIGVGIASMVVSRALMGTDMVLPPRTSFDRKRTLHQTSLKCHGALDNSTRARPKVCVRVSPALFTCDPYLFYRYKNRKDGPLVLVSWCIS